MPITESRQALQGDGICAFCGPVPCDWNLRSITSGNRNVSPQVIGDILDFVDNFNLIEDLKGKRQLIGKSQQNDMEAVLFIFLFI
jgi:hypothetical protein